MRGATRGRSLVEVLVVLVLLGMLGLSATPALLRTYRQAGAAGAGREVSSVLGLAQALACSQGRRVGVLFLRRPDRWLIWRDDDLDRMPDPQELLRGPTRLSPGSEFGAPSGMDPITFVGDRVIFLPTRGVHGLPGSVHVRQGDSYARVTVLTNGRIRCYTPRP